MMDIWPNTPGKMPDVNAAATAARDTAASDLTTEEKHLRFVQYLVEHGYLTDDTAPATWAA